MWKQIIFQFKYHTELQPPKKFYLFAHVNVISSREDPFGLNLGAFYYGSVTSPFLLWKTYLNILSLIVFNSCYRHILSQFVPNSSYGTCRDFTVCAPKNCRGIVPNKIKAIFYKDLVFCNRIATLSCALFNLYVIIETFNSYQRVIDFFRVLLTQIEMNSFCVNLDEFLQREIKIEAYVSKKKNLVHLSLNRPLLSYNFFDEIIRHIRYHWNRRKYFYPGYFLLLQLRLNQSVKFKLDYILLAKGKNV